MRDRDKRNKPPRVLAARRKGPNNDQLFRFLGDDCADGDGGPDCADPGEDVWRDEVIKERARIASESR